VQGIRGVISTLTNDGQEVMGPGVLVWHYPDNSIVNNSLLTVESNHFCVLKSRGAILNVYDTGQYPVRRRIGRSSARSRKPSLAVRVRGSTKRSTSTAPRWS
jgi:hypothetical protein